MLPQRPARRGNASLPRVLTLHRAVDRNSVLHLLIASHVARLDRRPQGLLKDITVYFSPSNLLRGLESRHSDVNPIVGQRSAESSAVVESSIARQDLRPTNPSDPSLKKLPETLRTLGLTSPDAHHPYKVERCAITDTAKAAASLCSIILDRQDVNYNLVA